VLLIGIDEAGYGPLLGPLCHGYCAIRVPDAGCAPDLWTLLSPAIARHPAPPGAITLDDSKVVHAAARGRELMAASVAALLCARDVPRLLHALLDDLERGRIECEPWGLPHDSELRAAAEILAAAAVLSATLTAHAARCGASVVAYGARAISARDFNTALAQYENKADLNCARALELVARLVPLAQPGEAIHVAVDRLGGRKFYSDCLQPHFPEAFVWVESESADLSAYRVETGAGGAALRVEFRVDCEQSALPVAAASMAAKLTRELCMERFNAYFCGHMKDLAPTAGYYNDARRFLKDTRVLRKNLAIDDAHLIRER
jgi:hypothetical protein